MEILMVVVAVIVLINLILTLFRKIRVDVDSSKLEGVFKSEIDRLAASLGKDNSNTRSELINLFTVLKSELNQGLMDNRSELNHSLTALKASNDEKLAGFSALLSKISDAIIAKQDDIRKETEAKLTQMQQNTTQSISTLTDHIKNELGKFGDVQTRNSESSLKKQEEIRKETESRLQQMQESTAKSITGLTDHVKSEMAKFGEVQTHNSESTLTKQEEIRKETENKLNEFNQAMKSSIEGLSEALGRKFTDFSELQKRNSEEYIRKHDEIKAATDQKLESIRKTVQERLEMLQDNNSKKLDEMRMTVDEKLQKTINSRITEAFKQVTEQLESVNKGLGEMTSLANDVGGLKKVLTNVKTRGIIGEIQLGGILESILTPDQYATNVAVKKGSQERVEYAIKLPGKDEDDSIIYLPIDSKFPDAAYQRLLDANNESEPKKITAARKELENAIRNAAKDIHYKYISPPETTDFAIMFLPFEGLYAEVLQNTNLVHSLQNDLQICVAGPTTLGAFINSLQMGFRTLQVQKRSSEVWKLLGAVKSQFQLFGDVLNAAQKKLKGAGDDIEKLVGTRTRMIQAKLKNIPVLEDVQAGQILEINDEAETIIEE